MASSAFGHSGLLRQRPFNFQTFLSQQSQKIASTMSGDEKVRTSGDASRPEPTLPTVNPAVEKPAPPKPSMHPAFYVT